jgi:homoserine kinase type II
VGVFTSIDQTDVETFAENYDLGRVLGVVGIPAGSVNSNFRVTFEGGERFLRLYEEQPMEGALIEAERLRVLSANGVPTPCPVERKDGKFVGEIAGKPAAVFPWCEGTMRCQAGVTRPDAARVGEALAKVHVTARSLDVAPGRFEHDDLLLRVDRIQREAEPELAGEVPWLRAKLSEWQGPLGRRSKGLPRGFIHGDLFRDNVLWAPSGEISALLDFESASAGVYAYDLMVTVLAWCFGDDLDDGLATSMIEGYDGVRPLSAMERDSLWAEACAAALRFTVTRITDYAMRKTSGPRVVKDWRRFRRRFDAAELRARP